MKNKKKKTIFPFSLAKSKKMNHILNPFLNDYKLNFIFVLLL